MQEESKISIPFRLVTRDSSEHPGVPISYVDHDSLTGADFSSYTTHSKAKTKFRKTITEQIERGFRALGHHELRVLAAKDGSVFVVRWDMLADCWGYEITGPDRKWNCSSPLHGVKTFTDAIEKAKQHIIRCFGGIAWGA